MPIATSIYQYFVKCRDAWREMASTPLYTVLAVITAIYVACVMGLMIWQGQYHRLVFFGYNWMVAAAAISLGLGYVVLRPYFIMVFHRPDKLTRAIAADYAEVFLNPRRWMPALIVTLIFLCFFPAFTSMKSYYPEFRPFAFDALFADLDRALHFGNDPWRLLQPLLGAAAVTFAIGFVYKLWFLMKFYTMFWQGYSLSRPDVRAQFFLSLMLCWIINGTLFAILFSSAGPCYFDFVHPDLPNPYTELMQGLVAIDKTHPVWSMNVQALLWTHYMENHANVLTGISAFPSMHVSIAFIFMMAAWRYGRGYGLTMTIFFIFTIFGSVWLGWHYAVDGYFSIITSYIIWRACGYAVRRYRLHEPIWKKEQSI